MRITRLEVSNFRSISNLSLSFTDPCGSPLDQIFLMGESGAGKTTILEAILLLLGKENMLLSDNLSGGAKRGKGEKYNLAVTIANGKTLHEWGTTNAGLTVPILPLSVSTEYIPAYRSYLMAPPPVSAKKGAKSVSAIKYYASIRNQLLEKFADNLMQSALPGILDVEEVKIFDKINTAWKVLRPHFREQFLVKMNSEKAEDGYDIYLRGRVSGLDIPIGRLGGGEQEAFNLLAMVASSSSEANVILIDEPELHLSFDLARNITSAIRTAAPTAQLIMVTNNSLILEQAYSFERFYLSRSSYRIIQAERGV